MKFVFILRKEIELQTIFNRIWNIKEGRKGNVH